MELLPQPTARQPKGCKNARQLPRKRPRHFRRHNENHPPLLSLVGQDAPPRLGFRTKAFYARIPAASAAVHNTNADSSSLLGYKHSAFQHVVVYHTENKGLYAPLVVPFRSGISGGIPAVVYHFQHCARCRDRDMVAAANIYGSAAAVAARISAQQSDD